MTLQLPDLYCVIIMQWIFVPGTIMMLGLMGPAMQLSLVRIHPSPISTFIYVPSTARISLVLLWHSLLAAPQSFQSVEGICYVVSCLPYGLPFRTKSFPHLLRSSSSLCRPVTPSFMHVTVLDMTPSSHNLLHRYVLIGNVCLPCSYLHTHDQEAALACIRASISVICNFTAGQYLPTVFGVLFRIICLTLSTDYGVHLCDITVVDLSTPIITSCWAISIRLLAKCHGTGGIDIYMVK